MQYLIYLFFFKGLTNDVRTEQQRRKAHDQLNDDTSTSHVNLIDDVKTDDIGTGSRRSFDPPADDTSTDQNVSRRNTSMEIDDIFEEFHEQSPTRPVLQDNSPEYLTKNDFNYTMTLIDKKINLLFKLCRRISDKQQENSK